MSDPKSSYGEPVDEPRDAAPDVVGRAHEGLADAEAAGRSATAEPDTAEPGRDETPAAVPYDEVETVVVEERTSTPDADVPWYERDDVPLDPEPSVTASEPVYEQPDAAQQPAAVHAAPAHTTSEPSVVAASAAAQPIFVQAPEAPRPRSNRGAIAAIGLLAAVAFAVLYLAAWLGIELLGGDLAFADVPTHALEAVTGFALWVPVVVFYLAFCLLGAVINRGAWGHWVVWGLLVGVAAWGGHILGQLFQAPFWMLTAREGGELIEAQLLAPLAIVAFVLGRELTIWFGAWAAARGRRVSEINAEAQREYERTLEAGPQLARP